jgi:hypothetical protein
MEASLKTPLDRTNFPRTVRRPDRKAPERSNTSVHQAVAGYTDEKTL